MADIICVECKANVSDDSGYCTECGYPFENMPSDQNNVGVCNENSTQPNTAVTTPSDLILRSLNSVTLEMHELRGGIDGIRQELSSISALSTDSTRKAMVDISAKLDTIVSLQSALKVAIQADAPKKSKRELLAAFYKTLNSPNSMFEYMFYICIVQIVFVIVILFLATYIVTLIRH